MSGNQGRYCLILIWAVACLIAVGCSGGSPLAPDAQPGPALTQPRQSSHSVSYPALWGLWDVTIDPATGEVEITPLRGCQFTVDVVTFLQPPAGKLTNLSIKVTNVADWFTEGLITVDVGLTHPFPGMDQYTGHDVKGVFIAPGSLIADSDDSIVFTDGVEQPILLNADGYTRWQNPSEFTPDGTIFTYKPGALGTPGDFNATINGYKYFAGGIGADDDVADFFADPANTANRGQFRAGSSIHRIYELKFPLVGGSPKLTFQYAVIAHWVEPTELDPYDIPGSFPPEANVAEAVHAGMIDNSNLWYSDGESGGVMKLDLEIFQWQPYLTSGVVTDFVHSVILDFPGGSVTPSSYEIPADLLPPALPAAENSSVVPIEIVGLTLASSEPIDVVISIVTDDGEGNTLEFNPGNGTTYNSSPLAAYFRTTVAVGTSAVNPTVTSIVPDHAYQHEIVDNAIITGTNFMNVTSVRLVMDAEIIEADTFNVDSTTQITADFDLGSHPFGLYDVVVEVQGGYTGVLADGFEILLQCGTTAPALDDVYTLQPYINTNWTCGILNAGPYEGYTIFPECNVVSNGYRVFNHMTQSDATPYLQWTAFQALGNALMIEPAGENEMMMICPAYAIYYWQLIDQNNGQLKQNLYTGYQYGIVGDFDGDDDFWGIVVNRPNESVPNVYEYYLQHWAYNPSNPSTPYSLYEQMDVTSLFRDDIDADHKWEVFGDLVLLPDADYCLVLTGAQGGDDHKVDKVDLTGSSPTIVASYSFAGEGLDGDAQINIGQSRSVKMELDISDEPYIPCRLVVAGSKYVYSENKYYMNIYRFDTDLNLLDSTSTPYNIDSGYARKFYGMALDMENGVICHLTEFPWIGPETYYGISPLPADW